MTKLRIGTIFTPRKWAFFAIEQFDIFNCWLNGCTIFDPTMGDGQLLIALVEYGISKGYTINELPLERLFGNEINIFFYNKVIAHFQSHYNYDISKQLTNEDLLLLKPIQYDLVFGNPPWQNFVDLPSEYKPFIKENMEKYALIENKQKLLLGGSRIDIAALIIQATIKNFLSPTGDAYFFLPLSLFLNDGAHQQFRKYEIGDEFFGLKSIIDLNNTDAFNAIGTRHGIAYFKKGIRTNFPVPYYQFVGNKLTENMARPMYHPQGPLSIYQKDQLDKKLTYIEIDKKSQPRQGVNTCGANSIFMFSSIQDHSPNHFLVEDKFLLPKKFIYPLLCNKNFDQQSRKEYKWILLPYNSTGKVLLPEEVEKYPNLKTYLEKKKTQLRNRKGKLIQSSIQKGIWWSLLGVGPYSFSKYKIVWRAYGRSKFDPMIVEGRWQANQSLQAFIPTHTKKEAIRILKELKQPEIEQYLKSLQMDGTMNWAQPGKIKSFLKFR